MSKSNSSYCPVSEIRVDEYASRTGAAIVLLLATTGWLFNNWLILLVLAIDFLLRSIGSFEYSIVVKLARFTNKIAAIPTKSVVAKPKQFAAGIGAIFCLFIATGLYFGLPLLVSSVSAALLFCAFLEASIGYCVGCKVYTAIQLLRTKE